MITSFFIGIEIGFQEIWKKEDFQNNKHDKKLDQNYQPNLLAPTGKVRKTFEIKPVDLFE